MSRIQQTSFEQATGERAEIYSGIKKSIGLVPNLYQAIGSSPRALKVLLGIGGGLKGGLISAADQESIALAVAQANGCDYCLSAHSAIGKMVGLTTEQIGEARSGHGQNARATAALTFARRVLETRGEISDEDVAAVRAAGFNDGEVAEIIAHVALNVLTNYFNKAAEVEIDFPRVSFATAG